jgi:hypothetical protein
MITPTQSPAIKAAALSEPLWKRVAVEGASGTLRLILIRFA